MSEIPETEELVISIYGGKSRTSRDLIARTEVLAKKVEMTRQIVWSCADDSQLTFKQTMTEDTWFNDVCCLAPSFVREAFGKPVEIHLPFGQPMFVRKGDSITANIGDVKGKLLSFDIGEYGDVTVKYNWNK